jgi:putative oxidoreductase
MSVEAGLALPSPDNAVPHFDVAPTGHRVRMSTNLGPLLLRVTVGSIFIEHGTQKLFGWFGGHGPSGTGQFFESLGLRPGRRNAIVSGIAEAGGGALLVLGLATPAAASAVGSVMVTALRTAIWRDGIKVGTGGYEVLLLGNAVAIADSGPGPLSLDALLGWERRGARWAAAALAGALAGSALAIAAGIEHPEASAEESASGQRGEAETTAVTS